MALHIESRAGALTLRVEGELTIFQAAEYRTQLLAAEPAKAAEVVADLSATAELDGAGLQLLIALQKELQAAGHRLTLHAPAVAVAEALTACGLGGQFHLVPNSEPQ